MENLPPGEIGRRLSRGGERLPITKVPDRFTARLKRGVDPAVVERAHPIEHRHTLDRPRLDVFATDTAELDDAMAEVRADDDVLFASHVYRFEDDPSPLYLTDELTVQFRPEVTDAQVEDAVAEFGLELVRPVPEVPRTYVFRVTEQASENPVKIADRLLQRDDVVLSEPNVAVPMKSFYVPTDPLFAQQWHLHHAGGPFLAPNSHVDATRAWDITRGGRSVVVAVADDSCDVGHKDFQGPGKIVAARDFADRDFNPSPVLADDRHGTACCGVAVAEENGEGVVGAAPGCALMPIRTTGVLDDGSIEDLFRWIADRGAAVASCSWGPAARYFPLSLRQRTALERAATLGREGRGCVIVFAAGNSNRPVNGTVEERGWPAGGPSGPTRWHDGFAAHPHVIAVAACTSLGKRSAYSNWGTEISVCAPSNNARPDTYPRVSSPLSGRGIMTTDRVGPSGYASADYTGTFGGTSSACPLVAGVAALVVSANPALRAAEVKGILESTADKIVDNDPDPQLGHALGSYDANGHSQWFGHGKVNAFKAVTEAVRRRTVGVPVTRMRAESAPNSPIPDNDPTGVSDRIVFTTAGRAASVAADLDIVHPYVGDLRVSLAAPSGRTVVLRNRQGGSGDNVRARLDPTSLPALSQLVGEEVRGGWTLRVQDLAARDVGRLSRWALEIETRPAPVVELSEIAGVTIPDNDPSGMERSLSAAEPGRVQELELWVSILHPYVGDLRVALVSPSGKSVVVHDRQGESSDNIIRSYTTATSVALQPLRGEQIPGRWRLRVADLAGRDVGKLDRWGIKISREP